MAIEVPKEPKIYTSVYDNFKGVDFTNDVTNVYRRRSPDGLNMLPDLDGRPFKRTGWEVEITAEDFRTAARKYKTVATDAEVTPIRTYYFELGGHDFMMIFTTLGVFSVSDFVRPAKPSTSYLVEISKTCYLHYEVRIGADASWYELPTNLNPHTGFFFEGNGDAGFYVFCGLDLLEYKFHGIDLGAGYYGFKKIDPYVPTVLIGCLPNGTGEQYEQVSLLTSKRKVGYSCDGQTSQFVVPGGFVTSSVVVEKRNAQNGRWETVSSEDYTALGGMITFDVAPPEVYEGENNMRVTYEPDGEGAYTTTEATETSKMSAKVSKHVRYIRYLENGEISEWQLDTIDTGGGPGRVTYSFDSATLYVNRMAMDEPITLYGIDPQASGADKSIALSDTYATMAQIAYGSTYKVTPKQALYDTRYYSSVTESAVTPISDWIVLERGKMKQYGTRTTVKTFPVFARYTKYVYVGGDTSVVNKSRFAFQSCTRTAVFGNGIVNNVFVTASDAKEYTTRIWWSGASNPAYFPELNYIEVGATDEPIMGLLKIDNFLGVIKRGSGTNTSVYLAYPTSFADTTTYAVKQGVNGIGALANGAFNILEDEPLFLSAEGVMAVEVNDDERQLRNRSYFVNKKLLAESGLDSAISFIYDGMYWLAINNHVYVLDGSQKNSWANTKTNLQYEAYYLDNVPAQCFARYKSDLWFSDRSGNLCRFKDENDAEPYRDGYPTDPDWTSSQRAVDSPNVIFISQLTPQKGQTQPKVGDTILYESNGVKKGYTVREVEETHGRCYCYNGVPITAVWSTIADDDGAVHFFKNLKKKGSLVSLLPSSDSGVQIYLKPDRKEPVFVCETDAKQIDIPFDAYMKKKIKKYKRLQIICKNSTLDDAFGVDQIIKCYTMGNYSKNRG